jgi:hypothetical protein
LIAPNPVKDRLIIKKLPNTSEYQSVKLIDLNGRVVREEICNDECTLERKDLPPGTYLVEIVSGSQSYVAKVIFE